jgi:hypothetical protein
MHREQEKKRTPKHLSPDREMDGDEYVECYNGESLLSLVQPELISLSKHWLDVLKDYALLSLPPGK